MPNYNILESKALFFGDNNARTVYNSCFGYEGCGQEIINHRIISPYTKSKQQQLLGGRD